MKRRISLLLAAALASTTLMLFGPAQPASAIVVCASALAPITVNPGILYPVLFSVGAPTNGQNSPGLDHFIDILVFNQTNQIHSFTFQFAGSAACAHVRTSNTIVNPTASGILKGYCGHSSGTGTIGGAPFSYVSAGTFLILTGHVVGLASAIPAPATGSCLHLGTNPPTATFGLPGGATDFIITGVGVGLNCLNALPPIDTLVVLPEPTLFLPTQTYGLHVGPYVTHIWVTTPCVPQPLDHL